MNAAADTEIFITEIQRFCMHDGPGLRTTVFFKGCPLRCAWCHNPETQKREKQLLFYKKKCIACAACAVCPNGAHVFGGAGHALDREKCSVCGKCADICPAGALQICGKTMTAAAIFAEIEKDRAFYGKNGGVTVSGGEPFANHEGLLALLSVCKARGINTAVDTCGFFNSGLLESVVPLTDLFLWDVKDTDPVRHKRFTGAENGIILQNLRRADALGAKIRLRCILVNGVNTDDAHYAAVKKLASELKNCAGIDVLPYHAYSGVKAEFCGLPDNGVKEWIPDENTVADAKRKMGVPT